MRRVIKVNSENRTGMRLQIGLSPEETADFILKKQQTGCTKDKELYNEMCAAYSWLMTQIEIGAPISSKRNGLVNTPYFSGLEVYRRSLIQKQAPE